MYTTQLTYLQKVKTQNRKETPVGVSLTVPDQSMTIQEILRRFATGQTIGVGKQIYYDDLDDFDQIDPTLDPNFDLSDVSLIRNEIKEREIEAQAKRDEKANEEKQKAADSEAQKADAIEKSNETHKTAEKS